MATTLTPLQMAAHVDLSAAPTWWPKPQSRNTIWNTLLGNLPATQTASVSPLEKQPHD